MSVAEGQDGPPVRALVLAGGGAKCAYQAGVLQVWLDEARCAGEELAFELADGTSGGVFNLALWCQGESGQQIADAWRQHRPLRSARLNPWMLAGQLRPSVFTSAGIRDSMLPSFGVNIDLVRHGPPDGPARRGSFSVWDVTDQQVRSVPAAQATAELLLAAVSPPVWFPPVRTGGRTWTDAVFATDANLEAVLQGGATELWLVWTVSTRGRWRPGWPRAYFQLLETAANSRLKSDLDRIRRHNDLVSAGSAGEFGRRTVDVRMLTQEVPVHYLLDWRRSHVRRAVDLGVRDARRWCREQSDLELEPLPAAPPAPEPADLLFRETMSGSIVLGASDPSAPPDGGELPVTLALSITVRDVDRFLRDPDHVATATGTVHSPGWLDRCPVEQGSFNLLVDVGPADKRMEYALQFRDPAGRLLHLSGVKTVRRDGWLDSWPDTTTLAVELLWLHDGHLDGRCSPVAAGFVRLTVSGWLRQLLSLRAFAPTLPRRLRTLGRFAGFFAGELLSVYAVPRPAAAKEPPPAWLTAPVHR